MYGYPLTKYFKQEHHIKSEGSLFFTDTEWCKISLFKNVSAGMRYGMVCDQVITVPVDLWMWRKTSDQVLA